MCVFNLIFFFFFIKFLTIWNDQLEVPTCTNQCNNNQLSNPRFRVIIGVWTIGIINYKIKKKKKILYIPNGQGN